MKTREVKYLFKEGVRNTWVNGIMSIASILTVLACLIILGIFLLFSMNLNTLATDIESQYEVIAIIDENVPDESLQGIYDQASALGNIQEITLVTKDEALNDLREDLGESSAVLDGFEGENNPLRNQLHITLSDLNLVSTTVSELEGIDGIVEVNNNKELTDRILNVTDVIRMITFWVLLLLVVMTVIIISNTVKVAMFARRKEIGIMKFIGATDNFIRLPFIIEGVIIALIGCIIAFLLVFYAYSYFYGAFSESYSYLFTFVPVREAGWIMAAYFVVLSVVMGVIGSVISIRKYLKV